MSGRIPSEFIDELVARADIVDIIDQRVPLKKAGREYKGRCPFHDEKTPSFMVSPAKQFYHCFGCGAHGTVIGFLMEYDHLGFRDAVEELASRYGLQVPDTGARPGDSATAGGDLYTLLQQAEQYFRQQLRSGPGSDRAKDYLKGRGLTGEIAARYGLGYAPDSWDALLKHLTAHGTTASDLQTAGLTSSNDKGRTYDKFRNRIMFPIHDQRGRVIGFGGRAMGDGEPKYLNSPETPVFHKGKELYGLHLALDAIHRDGSVIVVEGYMDVIALAQAGIENTVAALGTATTPAHIERLYRHCNSIVFCFDGDRAGRQAAWRALENALPSLRDGRQASFLFLPQGEDPDTQVRRLGREAFLQQVREQTMPLPEYMLDHLSRDIDLERMDGKARLAGLARPLLGKLPAGTLRDLLTQRLAELTGLDTERLQDMLDEPPDSAHKRPVRPHNADHGRQTLISRLLRLLLNDPALAMAAEDMDLLRKLELAGMDVLCRIIDTIQSRPDLTISAIIERFRGTPYYERLCELAGSPTGLEETATKTEFSDAINRLRLMAIDQETGKLTARSTRLSEDEKTELRRLQKQRLALKQ